MSIISNGTTMTAVYANSTAMSTVIANGTTVFTLGPAVTRYFSITVNYESTRCSGTLYSYSNSGCTSLANVPADTSVTIKIQVLNDSTGKTFTRSTLALIAEGTSSRSFSISYGTSCDRMNEAWYTPTSKTY